MKGVVERAMTITISYEEQLTEPVTKNKDEPELEVDGVEHTVEIEGGKPIDMEALEEQPPNEARAETEATIEKSPVGTEHREDPRVEAEHPKPSRVGDQEQEMGGDEELEQQQQLEPNKAEVPVWPQQPESGRAEESEQQQHLNETPLDPLEQSLLDILDEE